MTNHSCLSCNHQANGRTIVNSKKIFYLLILILNLLMIGEVKPFNAQAQERPNILRRKSNPGAALKDPGTAMRIPIVTGKPGLFAPQLALLGAEDKTINGKPFTWISFTIGNWNKFSADLFKPAPSLPPCGKNSNSARTWLAIYNADSNNYIYGYCALEAPDGLKDFGYAIAQSQAPPMHVYVVLTDRQTNTTYKSNCINAWNGLGCGKP
jgi:hypothetical protein